MTGVMCVTLGMGSNFTAVFDNAQNINLNSRGSSGYTYAATYTINTNATCSKLGTPFGLDFSGGPTAWGTPTGGAPGNDYEARLDVTQVYLDTPAISFARFAGVDVTTTGYTPWYDLSSNRAMEVSSSGQTVNMDGVLYIRNKYSLTEISRAFSLYADPTY